MISKPGSVDINAFVASIPGFFYIKFRQNGEQYST